MTLSPEAQAVVDKAQSRLREVWEGTRPAHDRLTSTIAVGSYVARPVVSPDLDPEGGMVVAITEDHDPDTGQPVRAFKVVSFFHGRPNFSTLAEADIAADTIGPRNVAFMRDNARALASCFGRTKAKTFPLSWLNAAYRLAHAVREDFGG